MMASGTFGRYAATRSPAPDAPRPERSGHLRARPRRAPRAIHGAGACPRRGTPGHRRRRPPAAAASRFSAKLRRASGNHFAPGISVGVDERALAAGPDDARVVPDRAPERLALVVRPAPERRVVGQRPARRRRDPAREFGDVRRARCARATVARAVRCGHVRVPPGSARGCRRLGRQRRPAARSSARSGAATASGSGTLRPVARSIHTIFAAPSAYFLPFIQIS